MIFVERQYWGGRPVLVPQAAERILSFLVFIGICVYTCLHASSLRTTWLDEQLGSCIHMPACQQPAGPHPQCLALGRQQGRMQQGRSQPGTSPRGTRPAAAVLLRRWQAPGWRPCCMRPCSLPKARHCGCDPAGCWHAGMCMSTVYVGSYWPIKPRSA